MEWRYNPKQKLFLGISQEGEYSFVIDKQGIWISLDYEVDNKIYSEMAGIQRKTGKVIAKTLIEDKNGSKERRQISRLLHNKAKVKEIPDKKCRALAQLVLAEAEKLN